MGMFVAILALTTAFAGLTKTLSERIECLKRWKWHLAVIIEVIGVVVAVAGFWPQKTMVPATSNDVQSIVDSAVSNIQDEMVCRMDSLEASLLQRMGTKEDDEQLREHTRQQAECLEGIVETSLDKGKVAIGLEKYDEAVSHLETAVLAAQGDSGQLAEAWFYIGYAYSVDSNYVEGIDSFDTAIRYKADEPLAWYNRAHDLCELGRFVEAIESWDSAIRYKPDYHEAWYNRAHNLYELGQFVEAIESWDSAIRYKPDYHEAWCNRAVALVELNRHVEAIESYDTAIRHKPDAPLAWYNRGLALWKLDRHVEALADCDSALKYAPDDPMALQLQSWIKEDMRE